MTVEFRLTMKNAEISGVSVDYFELKWLEDLSSVQLARRFNQWLYDDEFLSDKLSDLTNADHCLLSISPM
jgi:hypothetical protein